MRKKTLLFALFHLCIQLLVQYKYSPGTQVQRNDRYKATSGKCY
jgi:uncharacterized membrane protein